MNYFAVRDFHIVCVMTSGAFFLVRGMWMMRKSPLLDQRWVKTFPHIVDTLLLGSAITLAIWSGQYPFVQGWLTAKVIALVAYIVLGSVALRYGKTGTVRLYAFFAALTAFVYIVLVAITKQVLPFS